MKKAVAILAIAGGLLLAYWLTVWGRAKVFQFVAEHEITTTENMRETISPAPGSLIGRLEISRIGLSVPVVEGVDDEQLRIAAGHIPGTAFPGENSNVAFAAHRDTHFRPLRLLRLDDEIEMQAGNRRYTYRVVSTKMVAPNDVSALYPTHRETLTLVTCYPFKYIGSAPQRFIARADCTNCGR